MKKRCSMNFALLGMVVIALLVSSCSDSSSGSNFTAEFTGCDFAGTTVARVEMFYGGELVAYGNGVLLGGTASFPMIDAYSGDVWLPALNITYTARGYCFAGSVGDPVPSNDYWRSGEASYTQYHDSEYAEIGFIQSYFAYVP